MVWFGFEFFVIILPYVRLKGMEGSIFSLVPDPFPNNCMYLTFVVLKFLFSVGFAS